MTEGQAQTTLPVVGVDGAIAKVSDELEGCLCIEIDVFNESLVVEVIEAGDLFGVTPVSALDSLRCCGEIRCGTGGCDGLENAGFE